MRAIFVEHPDAALAVAEHDEILAEKFDLDRRAIRLRDLFRQAGRNPVAPHDLAHRRTALDSAQQIVFFGGHHGGVSSSGATFRFLSRVLS